MIGPNDIAPARASVVACLAVAMVLPPLGSDCHRCTASEAICSECPAPSEASQTECHPLPAETCCIASPQYPACGCCKRPGQQIVPVERAMYDRQPEQLALHPAVATLPSDSRLDSAFGTASRLAALSPAIPHRVLHCSWLI